MHDCSVQIQLSVHTVSAPGPVKMYLGKPSSCET